MVSGINQASQMASMLFSKLDTKSQGYIEKSDLSSAFSQISDKANSASSTSVDDVFTALDSNSDGKVTKDEFSTVLAQLQQQMDSQRMQGGQGGPQGAGGPPPPPPPGNDAGFTKDELTSQLSSTTSSNTQQTDLMTKITSNFEAADTDSDGKVSFKEAMAYDQSTKTASTTDSSSTSSASNSEAGIMMKIMQLMQAYGSGQDQTQSGIASLLSVSA